MLTGINNALIEICINTSEPNHLTARYILTDLEDEVSFADAFVPQCNETKLLKTQNSCTGKTQDGRFMSKGSATCIDTTIQLTTNELIWSWRQLSRRHHNDIRINI